MGEIAASGVGIMPCPALNSINLRWFLVRVMTLPLVFGTACQPHVSLMPLFSTSRVFGLMPRRHLRHQ